MSGQVERTDDSVVFRFYLDAAYALPEFRGDEDEPPLDLAWLRTREPEEWARIRREATAYLNDCIAIETQAGRASLDLTFPDFESSPPRFVSQGLAEMPPMIEVRAEVPFPPGAIRLKWEEPFGVVLILSTQDDILPVISGETVTLFERSPGFVTWVRIGWDHIVPKGLDHILFILGIFLLSPNWRPLLKQSLTFTLAHSATLIFAALGWVHLPSKPVEVLIALSITWIAIENFGKRRLGAVRYTTIAVFGLIHGLGFAGMLAPLLPPGRPEVLLSGIVGFNLGVEAGQVAVLAVALACFGWWKKHHFDHLRRGGSLTIAVVGLIWAVERMLA